MCHRDDLDTSRPFAKHNQIWKPVEHRSAGTEFVRPILLGVLGNQINCSVKLAEKCFCGDTTAVSVPFRGGFGLIKGRRVDPDIPARHR
jgi:hypothetical protein